MFWERSCRRGFLLSSFKILSVRSLLMVDFIGCHTAMASWSGGVKRGSSFRAEGSSADERCRRELLRAL